MKTKADRRFRVAEWVVLALALLYLALSLSGFAGISASTQVTGGLYGGNEGDTVWGVLGTSTITNFIHALLGAIVLICTWALRSAPTTGWAATVGFGVLTAYAVVASAVNDYGDPLNLNWANVVLYAASAVVLGVAVSRAGHRPLDDRHPLRSYSS